MSTVTPPPTTTETTPTRKKLTSLQVQQRCMLILVAGFFGGVLVYSLTPEDGILQPISVIVVSLLVTWCMFKFAIND